MNSPVTHRECIQCKKEINKEISCRIQVEREIYSAQITALTKTIDDFRKDVDEFNGDLQRLVSYLVTASTAIIILVLGLLIEYYIRGGQL